MTPCHGCGGESIQEVAKELMPGAGIAQRRWLWRRLDEAVEARILSTFKRWEGTPYMSGQKARGVGVDCVQLVAAMMAELFRRPPADVPRMTADCAIHNARAGFRTIRVLRKAFGGDVFRGSIIEPGDVVVTRASHSPLAPRNPGHVLIAGVLPYTAFHAIQGAGAVMTTLSNTNGILRVYRPKGKELWA